MTFYISTLQVATFINVKETFFKHATEKVLHINSLNPNIYRFKSNIPKAGYNTTV